MKAGFFFKSIAAALMISLVCSFNVNTVKAEELVVVNYLPQTLFMSLAIKDFGDKITERTHGKIKFRYYWAGSLAGAKEIVPMV